MNVRSVAVAVPMREQLSHREVSVTGRIREVGFSGRWGGGTQEQWGSRTHKARWHLCSKDRASLQPWSREPKFILRAKVTAASWNRVGSF